MKQVAVRLNYLFKAEFGLRTRQATIIRKLPQEKKTREQIQIEIDDPDRKQKQLTFEKEQEVKMLEQHIFNLKYNDKNKDNYLQTVKIISNTTPTIEEKLPLILKKQPKQQKILISGIRRKIPASLKKLTPLCKKLIGKSFLTACALISASNRKAARFIHNAIKMVRCHAVQKGYSEERLFVHSIISGKYERFRKARFHAKAKINPAHRDTCQIKVILEERPAKELFKDFVVGKTPEEIGAQVKLHLLDDNNVGYEKIRQLQFMITSKGRQQQKLMIKRRVQKELIENKVYLHQDQKQNKHFSAKSILDRIVSEEADKLCDIYNKNIQNGQKVNLEARQTLFKRNDELNN